ncbi:hypothetical protein HDU98_006122, partial [Podochytrium sp. JEL0797]
MEGYLVLSGDLRTERRELLAHRPDLLLVAQDSLSNEAKIDGYLNAAIFCGRGLGYDGCETGFSTFRAFEGHTAMGRVNTTSSECAARAIHRFSLSHQLLVKKALDGENRGYVPYSKRPKTFRGHMLTMLR